MLTTVHVHSNYRGERLRGIPTGLVGTVRLPLEWQWYFGNGKEWGMSPLQKIPNFVVDRFRIIEELSVSAQ